MTMNAWCIHLNCSFFTFLCDTHCVSTCVGWKTDAIQCLTIERGNNNKTCWSWLYNVEKMTLCKKQWKSWRCVWRPNGYISKRNLVSEVTSMIIDQGQQQQCLGPMTQRPSSSWNSHINGGASLCSAWSWHSSSSMVVRIVGGPPPSMECLGVT